MTPTHPAESVAHTIAEAAQSRRAAELQRVPEALRPLLQGLAERPCQLLTGALSDLVLDTPEPFERRRGLALGMIYMASKYDGLSPAAVSALVGYVLDLPA